MASGPFPVPATEHDRERELTVEEVAARLGVATPLLIRRIEAGDVPARRVVDSAGGVSYRVRAGDLGSSPSPPAVDSPLEPTNGRERVGTTPTGRGAIELTRLDRHDADELRSTVAGSIDPRELVVALLDRWERTLEQRIDAEHRQRFEAELAACRSQIRQLQLELEVVRTQQAAALADRERLIVDQERTLSVRDQELVAIRASVRQRRRGMFRRG